MVPSSPHEVVQQAVEPISAALRRLSRAGGLEGGENSEDEDCENGRLDRRLSAGSVIDAATALPKGAKAKSAEHVWSDAKRRGVDSCSSFASRSCLDQVTYLGHSALPCTRWLCPYDFRKNLKSDLIAGCTVGVMVIPQSISYASLAGLDPIYGLYSALMPAFICEPPRPRASLSCLRCSRPGTDTAICVRGA
eukprot:COSAG02_NODE_1789_length_10924_cov_4.791224_3_plen_193_part_00